MKKIGIIGGMSWESTLTYYKIINKEINKKLGDLNSAEIIIFSVNFQEIEQYQKLGQWDLAEQVLVKAAKSLEKAGADFIAIATNTMHKLADPIQRNIHIPLIHIADAVGEKIVECKINTVGLLGTRFTMEEDFYKTKLHKNYNTKVIIPSLEERKLIHMIIYKELCLGQIKENSKLIFLEIIEKLKQKGAEGIILGCTEIQMIVPGNISNIKILDSTYIHCEKIIKQII